VLGTTTFLVCWGVCWGLQQIWVWSACDTRDWVLPATSGDCLGWHRCHSVGPQDSDSSISNSCTNMYVFMRGCDAV
jgi:hypothetical protein